MDNMSKRTRTNMWIFLGLFTLLSLSTLSVSAADELVISPGGHHYKLLGTGIMFICKLNLQDPGASTTMPELKWLSPDGVHITDTVGRIYIEKYEASSIRLYITNIQQNDAGLYTCQTEVTPGDLIFADTFLNLYAAIEFADEPTEITAKAGESVLLPCVATGQPMPEISWRHNREKIIDSAKYTFEEGKGLRINSLSPGENGTYECRAEVESQGNLKVRIISLDVTYPPVITVAPESHTIIEGESITLTCEAQGNPFPSFQWFREQKVSEMIKMKVRLQSESNTLDIHAMAADDVGRYFCKATNALGSKEAYADLDMMVPPMVRKLPHKVVLEGRTVIVPCEATGDPQPTITWSVNGTDFKEGIQEKDQRISIDSTQPGVSKLIIHDIQRSYSAAYMCSASSPAGTHSQIGELTVEYTPTVRTTGEARQQGWEGESRNFTCVGHGLPPPSMNWFRGGQYISNSDVYTIHTDRAETVTSTLQIKITSSNRGWVFGSYSCIAKNQYGYVTETVDLLEVTAPDQPRNVTIVSETPTSVVFKADAPRKDGGRPVTEWKLEYHQHGAADKMEMLFKNANKVKVKKLEPGVQYTFLLSAGNEAGFGKAVKFQVKTPKRDGGGEQVPADVPANNNAADNLDANATHVEAATKDKGKEPSSHPVGEQMEAVGEKGGGLGNIAIIGGLSGLVLLILLIIIIIVVARRRNRQRIPDDKFYNGGTLPRNGDTTVCVQGKEVDNIQLQIHRSPLPDTPLPHKSPESNRKHQVKQSNSAAQSPLLDPRKVAWDQMLMRQAMEDEQELHEQEMLEQEHARLHEIEQLRQQQHETEKLLQLQQQAQQQGGGEDTLRRRLQQQQQLPPPPPQQADFNQDLPPPPAFLLHSDEEQLNQGDTGSYHAVLDGYHSEDNVDDIDVDEPFRIQMPRNMYAPPS